MTPPSDDDDLEEDDELEEDDDEEQGGQAGVESSGLFAPPDDEEYDRIRYFDVDDVLPRSFQGFEDLNRSLISRPFSIFAARFTGGDRRTGAYEPRAFTRRVFRAAQLNRWVANSRFPGVQFPNVLATLPGSLIAHYAVPTGEERQRIAGHAEFPSVYGARAVARLLSAAGDEEVLLESVRPLGKLAVRTLLGALSDAANNDLTINWLTHEGQYTVVGPKSAAIGIEALSTVPRIVRRPSVPVVGRLNKPDHEKRVVRLQPLRGRTMQLHYPLELEPVIGESWRRWIVGSMAVEGPENPSLPKAPRRRRILMQIDGIYQSVKEIPAWVLRDLG